MENSKNPELENKNDLIEAFTKARTDILHAPVEYDFQQLCHDYGITPKDYNDLAYWELMASYQADKAQDLSMSGFESYILTIAGRTPSTVMHQQALDNHPPHRESRIHKESLSAYNGLVRDFAANYPNLSASTLITALRQVAHVTVAQKTGSTQTAADRVLHDIVHGAQHELAFGDILEQAALQYPGLAYRTTSVSEDLKGGDYVVVPFAGGPEVKVDVKASLSSVDGNNRGNNGKPFFIDRDGDIVMYSLIDPGDKFEIDPETAASRVPFIGSALTQALKRKAA